MVAEPGVAVDWKSAVRLVFPIGIVISELTLPTKGSELNKLILASESVAIAGWPCES